MSNDEEATFIWVVNGAPCTGTLTDYARAVEGSYYTSDLNVSGTVLTWDNTSDPITWKVEVARGAVNDDHEYPVTLSIPGLKRSATFFIDSLA